MTNTQRIEALEEKIDLLILLTIGGDNFNGVIDGNQETPLNERIKINEDKLQALVDYFGLREYNGIKYERQSNITPMGFQFIETPDE